MSKSIAVIGGGYGGIAVAKALDDVADVTLVEARDTFVHSVAALRGLVDPEWTDRIFFSYQRLLDRGQVRQDRAVRVDADSVTLGSGERIPADYLVLATGSAYPFPAKMDTPDSSSAKAKLHATRDGLESANRVLLLGAGPVGLELAGELKSRWPDKAVTIIDPATDILSGGFVAELRAELRGQLEALGVELVLGTSLTENPVSDPGQPKTFTARTHSGREITADIWFRCYGVEVATDYLAGELATARQPSGHVAVTPELRLPGQQSVFAIGDVTALPEAKMAKAAGDHAEVVAANIRTLLHDGGELRTYQPSAPGIALPLGPSGGASYTPATGVLDAATTSEIKGADLRTGSYLELLGLD